MGNACQPVKHNVVFFRDFREPRQDLAAFELGGRKAVFKTVHRAFGSLHQPQHVGVFVAAFVDFVQPVAHGLHQCGAAFAVFQQIVRQIRVAHHRPNVAQHFKQHPRRTPRFALRAQGFQRFPSRLAQQADDDFAVGIGCVVVRDFAQALGGRVGGGGHGRSCVLRWFYIGRNPHGRRPAFG